jgi:hypothetical protein
MHITQPLELDMYEYNKVESYNLCHGLITTRGMVSVLTTMGDSCIRDIVNAGADGTMYYCPLAIPSVVVLDRDDDWFQSEVCLESNIPKLEYKYEKLTFEDGVRYAFDYMIGFTSNNFHGALELQRMCDIENDAIRSLAMDMLFLTSPGLTREWRSITKMHDELMFVKEQLRKTTKALADYKAKREIE